MEQISEENISTLGQRIAQQRQRKGLSQKELAQEMGVARQTIYNWETDASMPSIRNMEKLCKILKINIEYFTKNAPLRDETEIVTVEWYAPNFFSQESFAEEAAISESPKKKYWGLLAGVLAVLALFLVCAVLTFLFGLAVFSTNTGAETVYSVNNIELTFFCFLMAAIIFFIADIVLIAVFIGKKRKGK